MVAAQPSASDGSARLPRKEADLFKSIVKFYETKQYKKGLKAADGILRKFPNHGETLAMRGLVLNCLERKGEAYDYVKRGLKADMRSHVCWHVYGLLHRSDRRYGDAIKSYKHALRIDEHNVQILRDLSLLQVQMRDSQGFVQTREKLLRLKSTNKQNWISFAVANHLAGSPATAVKVIDAYTDTIRDDDDVTYEDSELALYRNTILEERGLYEEALADLARCRAKVKDKTEWRKRRATLLLFVSPETKAEHHDYATTVVPDALRTTLASLFLDTVNDGDDAAAAAALADDPPDDDDDEKAAPLSVDPAVLAWAELLCWSPPTAENYAYHRGFQCALLADVTTAERRRELLETQTACETPADAIALDEATRRRLDRAYAALAEALPRSEAVRWIPLAYAPRETFEDVADQTIRRLVRKGAPALGSALERFFEPRSHHVVDGQRPRGADCCRLVLSVVDRHVASLRSKGLFFNADDDDAVPSEEETRGVNPPPFAAAGSPPSPSPRGEEEEENGGSSPPTTPPPTEPPLTLFWTLYLRTHCLEWLGELEEALETIDECAALVPTAVEAYEKRARLLKRSGDLEAAASAMDDARRLDLADRYINNKATKYLLRCGRVEEARRAAALFTRPEARDAEAHLRDMQATWYELEVGAAFLRRRDLGPALKKFDAVARHFADFVDDQFDFHTYCIRKMTLRAYVEVLRFEDRIRGHAGFRGAAAGACRLWLRAYDDGRAKEHKKRQEEADLKRRYDELAKTKGAAAADADQAEAAKKSAEDAAAAKAKAKREKLKQRKARAKEAKAANDDAAAPLAAAAAAASPSASTTAAATSATSASAKKKNGTSSSSSAAAGSTKKNDKDHTQEDAAPSSQSSSSQDTTTTTKAAEKAPPPPDDDDPDGAKLLASERGPLAEAADLASKLEEYASAWPDTHALAFDVALRRDKPLLALRALRRLEKSRYAEPRDAARRGAPNKREAPRATFVDRLAAFCSDPKYVDRFFAGGDHRQKKEDYDDDVVTDVVRTELADLCCSSAAEEEKDKAALDLVAVRSFVEAFAEADASLPSRAAAARALARLDSSDDAKRRAATLVCTADLADGRTGKPYPVDAFEEAYDALRLHVGALPEDLDHFRTIANRRFPRATAFLQRQDNTANDEAENSATN